MALTVGELMLADSYERDIERLKEANAQQTLALTEHVGRLLRENNELVQACLILLSVVPIVAATDPRHARIARAIAHVKAATESVVLPAPTSEAGHA